MEVPVSVDGSCFRFPASSVARAVADELARLHGIHPPLVDGDAVHVEDAVWHRPLTPEVVVGHLGRLAACAHPGRPDGAGRSGR